jgi:hypothetical protein
MPQQYTPSGSSQSYTIPEYGDIVDGETVFRTYSEDVDRAVQTRIGSADASVTQASTNLAVLRNITVSTAAPAGNTVGMDGDIWFVYV